MNRVTTSTASAGKVRGEMDDRLGGLAINLEVVLSTQDIVVRPGMTHDIWIDAGRARSPAGSRLLLPRGSTATRARSYRLGSSYWAYRDARLAGSRDA